jgi:hypothetical protein
MITCEQSVQLKVKIGGLDFNNLAWGSEGSFNPPCAIFTGSTYAGALATIRGIIPNTCADTISNNATMTYTGPDVACQCKVTIVAAGGGPAAHSFYSFQMFENGVPITPFYTGNSNTVFDFTVNAGVGALLSPSISCGSDIVEPTFTFAVTFEFIPHS